jgi:multidrug efflux pump subunit AcrB
MWIVRFALQRPYTFVIVAVLIAIFGASAIATTPTDILPDINIPIVSVIWTYSGLDADDMSKRIVGVCERAIPTTVNNVQYTESQSYSGVGVIKVHFQPSVQVDLAIAQVTALAQSVVHLMPPGTLSPYVLKYDASSVPIVQVSLGGKGLSQTELYDLGQNFIRGQLATINGTSVPLPYGGQQRSIMVDVEPGQLAANHLTSEDISAALNNQNLVTPSGTQKIGDREYLVGTNSSAGTIAELNNLPIRTKNGAVVQMKDVAWVHNGYQPQTSYVSENGQASALLTVVKNGAASTLTIVDQVKAAIPKIKAGLPAALTLTPIFDQSVIVRASIQDVAQEAITAAMLTALMILIFLGSWRSTLIVCVSIPLAALFAIAVSSALGETINVMSLGGLALAVGMLVDDATVEIENTHRNLALGAKKPLATAILDSAEQVAVPALISTMCICIVFVPVTLLSGSAKFIFTPLALNVVLAMIASYGLSRTLVPTMMHFLLPAEVPLFQEPDKETPLSRSLIWRLHQRFEHGFDYFQEKYKGALNWSLGHRALTLTMFAVVALGSLAFIPVIGRDFFPYVDSGQMQFHVRPPAGTRIETTNEVFKRVNEEIRRVIPPEQLAMVVNNIGLPPGGVNLAYSASDTTSNGDGDVLVLLTAKHRPTQQWMQVLRQDFALKFPQEAFFFEPADITNQTLNFGLPAPIDVQVRGKDAASTAKIAMALQQQIKNIPGAADVFVQQEVNAPALNINVDRLKAQELALTTRDISSDVLLSLSGSGQVAPNYWLDPQTGINYQIIVQVPQYRLSNFETLDQTPVTSPIAQNDQLLRNVSQTSRSVSPLTVSGVTIELSGQVLTMNTSFQNLEIGIAAAVIFVYLLMAMNFQSWTDPFIILTALPGAFAGIVWMLFLTQTTFNVPSLMGALMTIGVATANSILLVTFANDSRAEHPDAKAAALVAGATRLRPVCMTALAMIIGMLPMALSLGSGGEQNAPIGRAVIGGLLFATVGTLLIVPVFYSLFSKSVPVNWEKRLDDETQGAFK